jgi:hypothetical protein
MRSGVELNMANRSKTVPGYLALILQDRLSDGLLEQEHNGDGDGHGHRYCIR